MPYITLPPLTNWDFTIPLPYILRNTCLSLPAMSKTNTSARGNGEYF